MPLNDEGTVTLTSLEMSLYTYRAVCRRVVDGDTLDLDFDLGLDSHRYERVRLYGIDTPETFGVKKDSAEHAAGMKSKDRTAQLVVGKDLWVETYLDKKGKYGRYLANIWVEENGTLVCVNKVLVDEGLAVERSY